VLKPNVILTGEQLGAKLIIVNQTDTLLDQVADVVVNQDVSIVLPALKEALQKLKEVRCE
jgi:NAD-dependent SIR2 family protein deacetylase